MRVSTFPPPSPPRLPFSGSDGEQGSRGGEAIPGAMDTERMMGRAADFPFGHKSPMVLPRGRTRSTPLPCLLPVRGGEGVTGANRLVRGFEVEPRHKAFLHE